MRKIEFKLEEKSRANKVFLVLEYMSGDADGHEYEECEILGVDFSNWEENIAIIEKEYNFYNTLKSLLDQHGDSYDKGKVYELIQKEYGQEMADAYDEVPGDTSIDRQLPARLSDIELVAYDAQGNKYTSYL